MTSTVPGPDRGLRFGDPQLFTPPDRELTPETNLGTRSSRSPRTSSVSKLFPWQKWFYIHALELRPDGRLRYKEIHLTVARQNGKTRVIKTLLLWRLFVHQRHDLILGAAQNRNEAFGTWTQVKEEALDNPLLSPRMTRGSMKSGNEQVKTVWGASTRWSRSRPTRAEARPPGRCSWMSSESTRPRTLGTRSPPPCWSPGLPHPHRVPTPGTLPRWSCGPSGSSAWEPSPAWTPPDLPSGGSEWSAPDGCDLDDVDAWAMANPSLGWTIQVEDIQAARAKVGQRVPCREPLSVGGHPGVRIIPVDNWLHGMDRLAKRPAGARASVSIDTSWNRTKTAIAVAWDWEDETGRPRRAVEVVAYRVGMDWAVKWLQDRLTLTERERASSASPAQSRRGVVRRTRGGPKDAARPPRPSSSRSAPRASTWWS